MLVILASPHDAAAQRLVEQWAPHGAALLTSRDLSVAGWQLNSGRTPSPSTAIVGGQIVEEATIQGVLTRIAAVAPGDLADIVAADQPYVSAEMTAFLLAWLSELDCPVLNRPTPTCLSGPGWRPEHWVFLAGQLDIPVREVMLGPGPVQPERVEAPVSVTVVNDRCFGDVDDVLAGHARRLAAAGGVDLLKVQFSGSDGGAELVGASAWPEISAPDIAGAILERLLEDRQC